MSAYVIVNVDVHDAEAYRDYTRRVPDSIAAFGGRFLVRAGAVDVREGDWQPGRLVVLEFEDVEHARDWYESEGYEPLKRMRQAVSSADLLIVEGVERPT